MELTSGYFPKLLIGTFAVAILGFFVRGFGQLFFGVESARLLAAPVFGLGILMAVLSLVLSLLVTLGLVEDVNSS